MQVSLTFDLVNRMDFDVPFASDLYQPCDELTQTRFVPRNRAISVLVSDGMSIGDVFNAKLVQE